jgi:hypothetical protein
MESRGYFRLVWQPMPRRDRADYREAPPDSPEAEQGRASPGRLESLHLELDSARDGTVADQVCPADETGGRA